MDHPAKRLKISRPDSRSPRDAGSRMKEGLFTSELGTRSDEADGRLCQVPTRTMTLYDMQRGQYGDIPRYRSQLMRRDAAHHLLPRVPDATVTSSVVDVNVDVGSTTLDATVVAAATSEVLVSVSSLGTLTIPAVDVATTIDSSVAATDTLDSLSVITSTPLITATSLASSTSTDTLASALTASSSAAGSNSTLASSESTVTVTATSTLNLAYTNGTFVLEPSTSAVGSSNSMSITSTGHQSTLMTSILSSGRSSNTAVFGSSGPAETSFSSGGSAASSTNGQQGGVATSGSSTGSAASASSASSSGDGSSGSSLTPTQQQVVGGVVGGVAGIAVILLVALVFLRWYRRRLKSQGRLPEQQQPGATRDITTSGGESFAPMSERSSNVPLAAAMASVGRRLRSQSSNTFATTATGGTSTTVPESERGFQRIAGRKIAPVISAGVDQYGGNYGAFEKDVDGAASSSSRQTKERELAGTSFYRDSGGFYGGKGPTSSTPSPAPTTPSAPTHSRNVSNTRDFAADSPTITASKPEGFAVLRPSPARTPTTRSPSNSSIKLPIQQVPSLEPEAPPTPALPPHLVAQRDAIGRSLASQDGSRVSRASKGSGSRFSERI